MVQKSVISALACFLATEAWNIEHSVGSYLILTPLLFPEHHEQVVAPSNSLGCSASDPIVRASLPPALPPFSHLSYCRRRRSTSTSSDRPSSGRRAPAPPTSNSSTTVRRPPRARNLFRRRRQSPARFRATGKRYGENAPRTAYRRRFSMPPQRWLARAHRRAATRAADPRARRRHVTARRVT
jgi:hypothetical protein